MENLSGYNKLSLAITVTAFFLFIFAWYFYLGPVEDFRYAKPIAKVMSFLSGTDRLEQPELVSGGYVLTKQRSVYFSMLFFIFLCMVAIALNVYGAKRTGATKLQMQLNFSAILVAWLISFTVYQSGMYKYV